MSFKHNSKHLLIQEIIKLYTQMKKKVEMENEIDATQIINNNSSMPVAEATSTETETETETESESQNVVSRKKMIHLNKISVCSAATDYMTPDSFVDNPVNLQANDNNRFIKFIIALMKTITAFILKIRDGRINKDAPIPEKPTNTTAS